MQNFKQVLKYGEALEKMGKLTELARAFVHYPENWETFEELKTSNSASIPAEFMLLCEAVEDLYGPPVGDCCEHSENEHLPDGRCGIKHCKGHRKNRKK